MNSRGRHQWWKIAWACWRGLGEGDKGDEIQARYLAGQRVKGQNSRCHLGEYERFRMVVRGHAWNISRFFSATDLPWMKNSNPWFRDEGNSMKRNTLLSDKKLRNSLLSGTSGRSNTLSGWRMLYWWKRKMGSEGCVLTSLIKSGLSQGFLPSTEHRILGWQRLRMLFVKFSRWIFGV